MYRLPTNISKNRGRIFEVEIDTTKVVSVKLNISTIKMIDDLAKKHGFSSRSDFIRAAIDYFITHLRNRDLKHK